MSAESKPKQLSSADRIKQLEETVAGLQSGQMEFATKLDGLAQHIEQRLEEFKAGQSKLIQDTTEYTISRIRAAGQQGGPAAAGGDNMGSIVKQVFDLLKSQSGQPITSDRVAQINEFASRVELSMWKKMARDVDRLFGGEGGGHVEIGHG